MQFVLRHTLQPTKTRCTSIDDEPKALLRTNLLLLLLITPSQQPTKTYFTLLYFTNCAKLLALGLGKLKLGYLGVHNFSDNIITLRDNFLVCIVFYIQYVTLVK